MKWLSLNLVLGVAAVAVALTCGGRAAGGSALLAGLAGWGASRVRRRRAPSNQEPFSFSHMGTWEVDLSTGFGSWSSQMYEICGLEPLAADGAPPADLLRVVHPNDRPKLIHATEQAAKDLKSFQLNHRIVLPDGGTRNCLTQGKILVDSHGQPVRMVGATQDTTDQARIEASLRDAEARFFAFMDHSPFSAWMRDSSGQFVYSNERFAEHMGMQAHEIVGSDQKTSWLSSEYIERSLRDDQRVLELGRSSENIEHVPMRDGTLRHWLVLKFPIRNQSGQTLVGGVALDLTGRYESDEKLRASEKRLRSVMQSASEGIAATDSYGKIISWNDAASKIFGYDEAEILGAPLTLLLSDSGKKEYETATGDVRNDVRSLVVAGRRKSGENFDLEFSRSSWRNGSQTFVTAILRDVTERKKIEEQLKHSEAQMRMTLDAALDAVPQIVWTARTDGQLSFVNRRWFEYVGVSFPLVNEQGWLAWVHPDDVESTLRVWRGALSKLESCEMEYRLKRGADSAYRWHLGRAMPVRDSSGKIVQWFGTSTDIHDHKHAQEEQAQLRAREASALETSRLKSEFLAHMSHEIRTPINGVIGMTGLLLDTSLDSQQEAYADTIRRSAEALLFIINDILDFSKIEAGRLEIEEIDFDLQAVLDDVEKTLVYQAQAKGLKLRFERSSGTPDYLRGDPGRLRQVLGNLVSNSIKFTATGEVSVQVAVRGNSLVFEVIDSGIGIAESAMGRMFQPFSQADSSTSRHFGGTGLGLSICKRLIEQMQGSIGVKSEVGVGSTFYFTLPLIVAPSPALHREAPGAGEKAMSARSARLLVAEDNEVNQTIILKQLEKMGHYADAVMNGHQVLAALKKSSYDLILMDCQMPGMDGYEATARIRASDEEKFKNIPIVAVTANAILGDREKCLALGMNDYVSKPVRPAELGRALTRWLAVAGPRSGGDEPSGSASPSVEVAAVAAQVIDLSAIEELRMLDDGQGEVLQQLVGMFAESGAERIALISMAFASGDIPAMNREAHTLKSSAGNLGAHRMAALCQQIESAKTPEAVALIANPPAQLKAEFEQALLELQTLVNASSSVA